MIFHWDLKDSKSLHVSRTLLSLVADFTTTVVWMVSSLLLIYSSSNLFSGFWVLWQDDWNCAAIYISLLKSLSLSCYRHRRNSQLELVIIKNVLVDLAGNIVFGEFLRPAYVTWTYVFGILSLLWPRPYSLTGSLLFVKNPITAINHAIYFFIVLAMNLTTHSDFFLS